MQPFTYAAVTAAATGAALFLWFLLNLMRVRRMDLRRTIEAELVLGDCRWKLQGLIDSGNDLKDPLTGRPVCIIDRQLGQRMLEETGDEVVVETRYRAIPYRAVGTERGVLEGFRIDALFLSDGFMIKNPVIAFCEEKHFRGDHRDTEILLPASLLERGVYGDL